tara:strand:- start:130 stop:300 length:171 start_codon:yes stop_codon:yes gene_type:complete
METALFMRLDAAAQMGANPTENLYVVFFFTSLYEDAKGWAFRHAHPAILAGMHENC